MWLEDCTDHTMLISVPVYIGLPTVSRELIGMGKRQILAVDILPEHIVYMKAILSPFSYWDDGRAREGHKATSW